MTIILQRINNERDRTFGVLHLPNRTFFTLELPWRDNNKDLSCIPAGLYQCTFSYSPHFDKKTYLLTGVKDRTSIRIHSANFPAELKGCIALGEKLGVLNGERAVLNSRQAVGDFEKLMDWRPFELEVKDEIKIPVT